MRELPQAKKADVFLRATTISAANEVEAGEPLCRRLAVQRRRTAWASRVAHGTGTSADRTGHGQSWWQSICGRGLVNTPEDSETRARRPTPSCWTGSPGIHREGLGRQGA